MKNAVKAHILEAVVLHCRYQIFLPGSAKSLICAACPYNFASEMNHGYTVLFRVRRQVNRVTSDAILNRYSASMAINTRCNSLRAGFSLLLVDMSHPKITQHLAADLHWVRGTK